MKILIGIQPSGRLHIGNYLGVIKKGVELQKENDVLFLIADFHALTSQDEPKVIENTIKLMEDLKKLGAKKVKFQGEKTTLIAYKLACITPLGLLHKMTQYKEKKDTLNNAGLLFYPILMTADILESDCDAVLVGSDQMEHLEFANSLFKKIKHKKVEAIFSNCPRIMDLKNPEKKMSKSSPAGCLFLDEPEKIMKAKTDEAGLKNIINIGAEFGIKYDGNNQLLKERIIQCVKKLLIN